MIIDIRAAANGQVCFLPHDRDAFPLMEMLMEANLDKNVFLCNYEDYEDGIVFEGKYTRADYYGSNT